MANKTNIYNNLIRNSKRIRLLCKLFVEGLE
jgi:hypothetical protein